MSDNQQTWKDVLKYFATKTTFHGIPNIVVTKRTVMKLIWLISLIAMTCLCFVEVVKNLKDYYRYEVDTVIEITNEQEFEFPTLTFCNLQICGFKDYDFQSYLKKYKQDENEKFGFDQGPIIDEKLRKNNTKTSFFSAKEIFLRKYDETQLIKILSKNKTSVNTMLLSCRFGENKCNESDFEFFQMGEFSKCYKFNSGFDFDGNEIPLKKTTKYGKSYGFRMELFVGSQDDCKSPLSSTSGLAIYVHNHAYTLTEEDNGIQVQPGTEVTIAVDRTTVTKLSEPYSDCFQSLDAIDPKKADLISRTINLTKIYTQQYCLQLCYQNFLIRFCDCFDHTLPNFQPTEEQLKKNISTCPKFIDSLYNCQYLIKRIFYNGKNDEHCLRSCPKECDYIKYDTTISSSQYPANGYYELMNKFNISNSNLYSGMLKDNKFDQSTVLAVNVFYISSSYMKISENPSILIYDLLPNIGGTMGLFVGISVLSFVEFIEIAIELLAIFWRKLKNSQRFKSFFFF